MTRRVRQCKVGTVEIRLRPSLNCSEADEIGLYLRIYSSWHSPLDVQAFCVNVNTVREILESIMHRAAWGS